MSTIAKRLRAWQGGLDNDQLRVAFKRKLPAVEPTERDLSVFALGIEVGESIDASAWNRLHHVLKNHGLHPGRTDDNILDIVDAALSERSALQTQIAAIRTQVPDGWVAVPLEPTQTMCQEGQWKAKEWPTFPLRISPIYKAMIAAAPSNPTTQPPVEP